MVFISQVINELKKTKVFKGMVDKAAKDKLREEEQKQKQKQDRWLNKKGASTSTFSKGRRGSIGKGDASLQNRNASMPNR